jgi:hypothetical protein
MGLSFNQCDHSTTHSHFAAATAAAVFAAASAFVDACFVVSNDIYIQQRNVVHRTKSS